MQGKSSADVHIAQAYLLIEHQHNLLKPWGSFSFRRHQLLMLFVPGQEQEEGFSSFGTVLRIIWNCQLHNILITALIACEFRRA